MTSKDEGGSRKDEGELSRAAGGDLVIGRNDKGKAVGVAVAKNCSWTCRTKSGMYWGLSPILERLDGDRAGSGEPKTRVKSAGKTLVETPVKMPVKILTILKDHPEYTLTEVAAAIGKSLSAVERASAKLVKAGKLRRVGPAKGGHWEVLE